MEQSGRAKRAEDFIGRHVMKAKGVLVVEPAPVLARGFEQDAGADNVGVDEFSGAIDGTVDVRLGREVHDRLGLILTEQLSDRHMIADIAALEMVVGVIGDRRQ